MGVIKFARGTEFYGDEFGDGTNYFGGHSTTSSFGSGISSSDHFVVFTEVPDVEYRTLRQRELAEYQPETVQRALHSGWLRFEAGQSPEAEVESGSDEQSVGGTRTGVVGEGRDAGKNVGDHASRLQINPSVECGGAGGTEEMVREHLLSGEQNEPAGEGAGVLEVTSVHNISRRKSEKKRCICGDGIVKQRDSACYMQ